MDANIEIDEVAVEELSEPQDLTGSVTTLDEPVAMTIW
eukprot:CAMPEP_0117003914 /NCGR_PEP_ID=MMETSP0472-20121206/5078_1 /TAXON_ID=693140 ORGANISM="Tiarina fusus, Strain LIS" /NCGR_SAMPLE_ID=MMETSP0472 /ASSEMBLY_ACC=CAM_ASM_000603 /LENGTH=37 /DNA_ID= /DNA_START= /DNA_END= /DNA_ORIENTATION=